MLDQLFNIVRNIGQDTVVKNPEVPNEKNEAVMAEATNTIASGFQNILAGGGFRNILDLFKGRKTNNSSSGGIGGLLKNPIVTMMVGYLISKLVSKHNIKPAAASNLAQQLIPGSLNTLINDTNDPDNKQTTLDRLINSLIGKNGSNGNDVENSPLQDILDKENDQPGEVENNNGSFLQDLIGNLTHKAQNNIGETRREGRGGIMDMLKGLMSN